MCKIRRPNSEARKKSEFRKTASEQEAAEITENSRSVSSVSSCKWFHNGRKKHKKPQRDVAQSDTLPCRRLPTAINHERLTLCAAITAGTWPASHPLLSSSDSCSLAAQELHHISRSSKRRENSLIGRGLTPPNTRRLYATTVTNTSFFSRDAPCFIQWEIFLPCP